MRVKWIEFENLETGLKIERINFNDDITLLVGISGAGKTQILNAVEYSLKLAVTKYIELQPYKVTICIEIDNNEYIWAYTIDKSKIEDIIVENKEKYEFCYEKLEKNGILIFERNRDNIRVIGPSTLAVVGGRIGFWVKTIENNKVDTAEVRVKALNTDIPEKVLAIALKPDETVKVLN